MPTQQIKSEMYTSWKHKHNYLNMVLADVLRGRLQRADQRLVGLLDHLVDGLLHVVQALGHVHHALGALDLRHLLHRLDLGRHLRALLAVVNLISPGPLHEYRLPVHRHLPVPFQLL